MLVAFLLEPSSPVYFLSVLLMDSQFSLLTVSQASMSTPILRVTKGKALIICNAKFIRDEDLLGYRKDAVDMKAALTALRFDVDVIHDLKAAEMRAALSTVAKLEYRCVT